MNRDQELPPAYIVLRDYLMNNFFKLIFMNMIIWIELADNTLKKFNKIFTICDESGGKIVN